MLVLTTWRELVAIEIVTSGTSVVGKTEKPVDIGSGLLDLLGYPVTQRDEHKNN